MGEKVVLMDGHSILNRAYYGIPPLTNREGLHTNAVYGFLNIMFKIIAEENPDYIGVAFDVHEKTFRHKMFEAYKGTRHKADPEFIEQVPLIQDMLKAMQVPIFMKAGFEADDILGTIARISEEKGYDVRIISGDRDLLQLATDKVMIRIPKTIKGQTTIENYLKDDVKTVMGVTPIEYIDVKALQGDSSDNIPGVPGVGPKTATELIVTYKNLDNLYAHIDEITKKALNKNLTENKEQAYLSKTLATIITDAPIDVSFDDLKVTNFYTKEAYAMCKRLEFNKLLDRFESAEVSTVNDYELKFKTGLTKQEFDEIIDNAKGKTVAVNVIRHVDKTVSGIELSVVTDEGSGGNIFFKDNEQLDLFSLGSGTDMDIFESYIHTLVRDTAKLILPDAKAFFKYVDAEDMEYLEGADKLEDVYILAYLLNPIREEYSYDYVAAEYLGLTVPSVKETDIATASLIEADIVLRAYDELLKRLQSENMLALYMQIELPLTFVLDSMEKEGIKAEKSALKEYGDNLTESIVKLEKNIYKAAGEEFNINSPKQLGAILFEKLNLPNGKKTKTGYSTAADVLEKLSADYPIVNDILEYRTLSKLKSTYADGLINFIKDDGRIHTSFNQTVTATGRLSSADPNLQNIPIRMELGRLIRKVFVPKEGYTFVDADYSQIELRLLAHMSGDDNLIEAYRSGEDIHRMTASKAFNVPFDEVTDDLRRRAKAVNFGIVYGISAYGLSEDLHIPQKMATEYIENYFKAYPKIKSYLDGLVAFAKDKGYALTLYNRRRMIPEIKESAFMVRQFGERVAMNAPIQGTAADIMKIAMINVYKRLKAENIDAKILVQVHDELLIEAADSEVKKVYKILEEEMRNASKLSVDLVVDIHDGKNWYEAK
ncbi:MAG: DNA polymerase I [Lachnospiraceae bacterium]|nr:DNA polymerase I [Lachnospiraceae bacterium]